MLPASGAVSPRHMRMVVVLPALFGPITPRHRPGGSERDIVHHGGCAVVSAAAAHRTAGGGAGVHGAVVSDKKSASGAFWYCASSYQFNSICQDGAHEGIDDLTELSRHILDFAGAGEDAARVTAQDVRTTVASGAKPPAPGCLWRSRARHPRAPSVLRTMCLSPGPRCVAPAFKSRRAQFGLCNKRATVRATVGRIGAAAWSPPWPATQNSSPPTRAAGRRCGRTP